MTQKLAYLWGPISSFSGPLAALMVNKGWHVHVAVKPSLNLFSMLPLDLRSAAQGVLENAFGGHEAFKPFQDRIKFIDDGEFGKANYDAILFCGLPPNFDEPRAPRAHWSAERLPAIMHTLKGVPAFLVSSIWGGIQSDGVVPEEFEFTRRKPETQWESVCQQYEQKLLEGLAAIESPWYLIRLPMMCGAVSNGSMVNFSGPYSLFRELDQLRDRVTLGENQDIAELNYRPDSILWFLPADMATLTCWRFIEDESRPRICNLVSTSAMLNREWIQYLSRAIGFEDVICILNQDGLSLPRTLRKMLSDNIQVKTRNLFEVLGRYQLPPTTLDQQYFAQVIRSGRARRWGLPKSGPKPLTFSQQLAQFYFEEFVPSRFAETLLEKATAGGTTIGFVVKGKDTLGWILKAPNGHAVIERLQPGTERPRVCFHFSGSTLTKLIQSKVRLHRAVLLREVEVEGPILLALRATNAIEQFLRDHPIDASHFSLQD